MWQAFCTTLLFSLSTVCAQRSVRLLGGISANFFRICTATLILGLWAHLAGQGLSGAAQPWFFLSGIIGFGFGDLAYYQCLPRIGSRLSILIIHCFAAPFGAVVEWVWLGHAPSLLEGVAAIIILAGVALALAPSQHIKISRTTLWVGVSFGLMAALGQAMGAVISRKAFSVAAAAHQPVDGMTAAYQRIVGGIIIAALFFAAAQWRQRRLQQPKTEGIGKLSQAWPWVFCNALTGPALGVAMFQ